MKEQQQAECDSCSGRRRQLSFAFEIIVFFAYGWN